MFFLDIDKLIDRLSDKYIDRQYNPYWEVRCEVHLSVWGAGKAAVVALIAGRVLQAEAGLVTFSHLGLGLGVQQLVQAELVHAVEVTKTNNNKFSGFWKLVLNPFSQTSNIKKSLPARHWTEPSALLCCLNSWPASFVRLGDLLTFGIVPFGVTTIPSSWLILELTFYSIKLTITQHQQ